MTDDLKNLPPEERIKKLKKLEKEKKKEIEDTLKLLRDSEDELTDKKKWEEKVPIPEFAKESLDGLSEAEKEIIKEQKGIKGKSIEEESGPETDKPVAKDISLEETLASAEIPPNAHNLQYTSPENQQQAIFTAEYIAQQSRLPLQQLQGEMETLYRRSEEKGYLSIEEQRRATAIYSALDEKIRAVEGGKYSTNEETANAASMIKNVTGRLLDRAYQANSSDRQDWYKS